MKKKGKFLSFAMLILCIAIITAMLCACNSTPDSQTNPDADGADDWIVQKQATCTETGLKYRVDKSGKREEEVIPALGHSFDKWLEKTAPTSTSEGLRERKCTRCGDTEQQTISALVDGTNGLKYTYLSSEDMYYITGAGTATNVKKLVIPSTYMGKTVIYVYKNSFVNMPYLETVEFANDSKITKIYENAFKNCPNLTSVSIPESVTSISQNFAPDCPKFAHINVDANNGVYCAVDDVLYDKSVTKVYVYPPAKVGKFTVPDTVLSTYPNDITVYAFSLGFGITEFDVESENSNFLVEDGVLYSKGSSMWLNAYPHAKTDKTFTTKSNLKGIEEYAFAFNENLSELTIADSTETSFIVCDYAMCNTNLSTVTFKCAVNTLDGYVFKDCKKLKEVNFDGAPNLPSSYNGTHFGQYTFKNCTGLERITLPADLNLYEDSPLGVFDPFYGCTNLKYIDVLQEEGTRYKSVDGVIFDSDCKRLRLFPHGKTELKLPETLRSIGTMALKYNESLPYEYENGLKYYQGWLIDVDTTEKNIVVKDGTIGIATRPWYNMSLDSITLPTSLKYVSLDAFRDVTTKVFNHSDNFDYIDNHAFRYFNYTGTIDIGSPTYIGAYAFFKALTSEIKVGCKNNNVSVQVPERAFSAASIKKLYIGKYVESIGKNACYGTTKLEEIYIASEKVCESTSLIDDNRLFYNYKANKVYFANYIALSETMIKSITKTGYGKLGLTKQDGTIKVGDITYYGYAK